MYDEFEEEYESDYGEDGDYGSWYYLGSDTSENVKSHAMDRVAEMEIEKHQEEQEEGDEDEDFDPYDYLDEDDLEWVPEEEKEDWINNKIEDKKEEIDDEVKDMVSDFSDDNIKNAIKSHNEVMLSCKSYYLIDSDFSEDIQEQIKLGPPSKQKQLKFQFAYKKRCKK